MSYILDQTHTHRHTLCQLSLAKKFGIILIAEGEKNGGFRMGVVRSVMMQGHQGEEKRWRKRSVIKWGAHRSDAQVSDQGGKEGGRVRVEG